MTLPLTSLPFKGQDRPSKLSQRSQFLQGLDRVGEPRNIPEPLSGFMNGMSLINRDIVLWTSLYLSITRLVSCSLPSHHRPHRSPRPLVSTCVVQPCLAVMNLRYPKGPSLLHSNTIPWPLELWCYHQSCSSNSHLEGHRYFWLPRLSGLALQGKDLPFSVAP